MAKAGRGSEQAMIRLPDGMRDQIRDAAERNGRSMNAEIVERLSRSFSGDFVAEGDLSEIRAQFLEMTAHVKGLAEQLNSAADRERELQERLVSVLGALAESSSANERLIRRLEENRDVGQKA